MTATDLLRQLQERGVELRAEGDKLLFRPSDAVPAYLRAEMRKHKETLLRLLTWPPEAKQPAEPAQDPEPTAAERELIEWFSRAAERIPREPFELFPGVKVLDAEFFIGSLRRDIAAGPRGPRWRNGVLFGDLARLKELFG